MTAKPTFTSQISLGNWITLFVLFCSLAVGWGVMKTQQEANQAAISKIDSAFQSHAVGVRNRLRVLENEDVRAQERYSSMLQLLNRIDARLERIERRGE